MTNEEKRIYNAQNFERKTQEIHGIIYDYSKVDYKNCDTKVEIICKEHGSFLQVPKSHLRGFGCPKRSFENSSRKSNIAEYNKKTQEKTKLKFF